jgi:hypothetical protein
MEKKIVKRKANDESGRKEIHCTHWQVDKLAEVEIRKGLVPVRQERASIRSERSLRCLVLHFQKGSLVRVNQTDLRSELLC